MTDITERLREHAEIHEAHIPHDDQQRLWADDLRKAADEVERLREQWADAEARNVTLDIRTTRGARTWPNE